MRMNNRFFDDNILSNISSNTRYDRALKRVKRIKSFYIHLLVYILVNAFFLCSSYLRHQSESEIFWRWETFSSGLYWGVGLVAHGISVFGKNIFFGNEWEEKKIKALIEKDKDEKWE
ncbi:2TM domain-containing protein [Flavobacterium psychrophilum]|uniref:2TM domain-containing protein n=2 Tax=Flavobacterium psychrophilum TaxID=96345 RepID=UPI00054C067F|nr:2TM domain-containing protein [Flavobacterium psychrophilum]EKT2068294.1 2TM domain-containing protein [Flavobacterium psychrophilum]EKT2071372.1 2TM domain-containing protein [Flavobacterium psychrophilum]EKT3956832.1 2TM domain-containing protein [Flavobacterium psychrophilum]EKT4490893.1 2TM domain-containing protein [Flavobacterium psychrophilum]EKT4508465.1 2TM domain-containing protein [Flavobacterium psychrophilum]